MVGDGRALAAMTTTRNLEKLHLVNNGWKRVSALLREAPSMHIAMAMEQRGRVTSESLRAVCIARRAWDQTFHGECTDGGSIPSHRGAGAHRGEVDRWRHPGEFSVQEHRRTAVCGQTKGAVKEVS